MAVEGLPHLQASPDPLMQRHESTLDSLHQQVAPLQTSVGAVEKPASLNSTDPEIMNDLEASLMTDRPAPNGNMDDVFDRQTRRKQECLACNEAAGRMRQDRKSILSLEQRLQANDEQVAVMVRRADMAEGRIVDHTNELVRVSSSCDAQMAEMSEVLRTQREQLDHIGMLSARANNELAQSKFELQGHSELTMSRDSELQNAGRRINELHSEGQLASDHHRASLMAAQQQLERACIKDGSDTAGTAIELAEAHINLGRLQNELSGKVREIAMYDAEARKSRNLVLSTENDRNRLIVQHNHDQNEVHRLIDQVSQLEVRIIRNNNTKVESSGEDHYRLVRKLTTTEEALARANAQVGELDARLQAYDAKVVGPDGGHAIVRRAATEVRSAQNERNVAQEELLSARRVFNQKIEQIAAEHKIALDQSKSVASSLKSEVNVFTQRANDLSQSNAKLMDRSMAVSPIKTVASMPQPLSGLQTPVITPARSLSPSSSQMMKDMSAAFLAQLTAISAKVDQLAGRPTRGRSFTRTKNNFAGAPPLSGDGDPDDFGDDEEDEESEEEWDGDEAGDGESEGEDANVRSSSAPAAVRGERVTTERRTRERDAVKVPSFPTLPSLTSGAFRFPRISLLRVAISICLRPLGGGR